MGGPLQEPAATPFLYRGNRPVFGAEAPEIWFRMWAPGRHFRPAKLYSLTAVALANSCFWMPSEWLSR